MPNYILDEYQRNRLLEYMEEREDADLRDGERFVGNEEMHLATMLRDLKPLREVVP